MLSLNEYQARARRTSNTNGLEQASYDKLINGVMGMCGEAGECIDVVKKMMFQQHELDTEKLIEELGDVLWYCAELASGLGVALEDVALVNIEKLKGRYPEGFSAERSINRAE